MKRVWVGMWLSLCAVAAADAGPLRDRLAGQGGGDRFATMTSHAGELPGNGRALPNLAYGPDPLQRLDVYRPADAKDAPVLFMVHGGGWRRGDKDYAHLLENKIARWLPRGMIVVSVNYRVLPQADPAVQADDVARALKYAQEHAAAWGGDGSKFILMGHSAGAHLVALLTARGVSDARPWLGTVMLDSAAMDVPRVMEERHLGLYDQAFGTRPEFWREVSPMHQLKGRTVPFLAVCSSGRMRSCAQAEALVAKATSLGSRAQTLPVALNHGEINGQLGLESDYTHAVERFMGSLDEALARALK